MQAAHDLFQKLQDFERRSALHEADPGKRAHGATWAGVVFRIGDARLTVGIDRIGEILHFPAYTPVPGARPWLIGLANVRGNLMTLVDLSWFLSGVRSPITMRTRLLSAMLQNRPVGILVDEVFGQRHFFPGDAKSNDEDDTPLSEYVDRRYELNQNEWGVLNLDRLFSDPRFLNAAET